MPKGIYDHSVRFKRSRPIVADKTDFAYLAGLVDGEGSIIMVQPNKKQQFVPEIGIYNSDKKVLEWVARKFGGAIYLTNRKGKKSDIPFRKTVWQVKFIRRLRVLELCEQMLPYLKIKRVKAKEVLRRFK